VGHSSPLTERRVDLEKSSQAMLAARARQQLEGALACLDELECHQAAAYVDMALNLLEEKPPGEGAIEKREGS
jgi:hypothetical protein